MNCSLSSSSDVISVILLLLRHQKLHQVKIIHSGFDGADVQWECKAELDSRVKFGRISVSCEGYNHPDDPFVLRVSRLR